MTYALPSCKPPLQSIAKSNTTPLPHENTLFSLYSPLGGLFISGPLRGGGVGVIFLEGGLN